MIVNNTGKTLKENLLNALKLTDKYPQLMEVIGQEMDLMKNRIHEIQLLLDPKNTDEANLTLLNQAYYDLIDTLGLPTDFMRLLLLNASHKIKYKSTLICFHLMGYTLQRLGLISKYKVVRFINYKNNLVRYVELDGTFNPRDYLIIEGDEFDTLDNELYLDEVNEDDELILDKGLFDEGKIINTNHIGFEILPVENLTTVSSELLQFIYENLKHIISPKTIFHVGIINNGGNTSGITFDSDEIASYIKLIDNSDNTLIVPLSNIYSSTLNNNSCYIYNTIIPLGYVTYPMNQNSLSYTKTLTNLKKIGYATLTKQSGLEKKVSLMTLINNGYLEVIGNTFTLSYDTMVSDGYIKKNTTVYITIGAKVDDINCIVICDEDGNELKTLEPYYNGSDNSTTIEYYNSYSYIALDLIQNIS